MTSWHSVHGNLEFGVEWNDSQTATTLSITPRVYRWDRYNTDNYAGEFWDYLWEPGGYENKWGPYRFGSGSGTRQIDSFVTRTYQKKHEYYDIYLTVKWNESTGTWVSGAGFVTTGAGSHDFWIRIPALASYKVAYNANGGTGAPSAQTKWHGEVLTLSSTKPTRNGYEFQGWSTSAGGSVKYKAGARFEGNAATTLYAVWKVVAPAAPTDCVNTRNSDTKNTVSWKLGANAAATYANVEVYRSVDGGAWSKAATVAKSSTSWADASCSANHSYAYRVRAVNATGASAYATSGTTYNTPAAPTEIVATRTGEATVAIAITNPANTAKALELQRAPQGGEWAKIADVSGKVTSTSDSPGAGTFYYRARNKRDSLASAWSPTSNAVVTICAPLAPTLVSPASSAVVNKADETVAFEWRHNPNDGSAQTAAQLRYSTDGGSSWTTVDLTTESVHVVENAFAVNSEVTWSVRTKGSHADYGPWSENRAFRVFQEPVASIDAPADGSVVEKTPIPLSISYDDASGTLANAKLTVRKGEAVVYERDMGTDLSCTIKASEWLPLDGEEYELAVDARSSSSLTARAASVVTVKYVLPKPAALLIEEDEDTGHVTVVVNIPSGLMDEFGRLVHADGVREGSEAHGLSVYGRSVQEGEPTPDAPEPIESIGSAALVMCGRNLVRDVLKKQTTANGITFTPQEDGGIRCEGTNATEGSAYYNFDFATDAKHLRGKTVAVGGTTRSAYWCLGFTLEDETQVDVRRSYEEDKTAVVPENAVKFRCYISVASGSTVDETIYPMLTLGEDAAEHEPYSGARVEIDLKGSQLRSLPDGTRDELIVDENGKAKLVQRVGRTQTAATDGVTGEVGSDCMSSTGEIADGADVLHALEAPVEIDLGSVSLPRLPHPTLNAWAETEVPTEIELVYTSGYTEARSIDLYRVHDGERKLLGSGLSQGAAVVDRYAPLNDPYAYEAVTFADSGAVNSIAVDAEFTTPWAYMYSGSDVAKGKWNPSTGWSIEPTVDYVHYVGREHPVAYMRDFVDETHSFAATLVGRDEIKAFRKIVMSHEPVVFKTLRGEVFHAVPRVSASPQHESPSYYGEVSVELTRVDGEPL